MKGDLGFSMNRAQSSMEPRFFMAQVKLQREKPCLALGEPCAWAGQIAELRNHMNWVHAQLQKVPLPLSCSGMCVHVLLGRWRFFKLTGLSQGDRTTQYS